MRADSFAVPQHVRMDSQLQFGELAGARDNLVHDLLAALRVRNKVLRLH